MSNVSKILCTGESLKESIVKAVQGIGGLDRFVQRGDRVLIKPNINTADPFPASSDPAFIRAVVELTLALGASEVVVGDSSTFYQNTRKNFEKLGLFELEKMDQRVRVVSFDEGTWVKKKIGGTYLKSVSIPQVVDEADVVIFLPCLKTHSIAKFTGALKLGVGLMRPFERLALHARNTEAKVAELNLAFKPDVIIMDGRTCFITKGPSEGEIREPNVILASTSRVAIDIEGIQIIQGFQGNSIGDAKPEDLPLVKHALELGIE